MHLRLQGAETSICQLRHEFTVLDFPRTRISDECEDNTQRKYTEEVCNMPELMTYKLLGHFTLYHLRNRMPPAFIVDEALMDNFLCNVCKGSANMPYKYQERQQFTPGLQGKWCCGYQWI